MPREAKISIPYSMWVEELTWKYGYVHDKCDAVFFRLNINC
jgi:hypothetical protein